MTPTLIFFAAAGGWCGTPYPGWLRDLIWRLLHHLPPPPPPDPWWKIVLVSIIAGIAGGFAVINVIADAATVTSSVLLAVTAGGFLGGRIIGDIAGRIMGQSNKN